MHQAVATQEAQLEIGRRGHVVQFYERDLDLFATAGRYLVDAFREGAVVVVVATDEHRRGFEALLERNGVDVEAARASGRLLTADAQETLARLLRGDSPDRGAFDEVVGGLIRSAVHSGRPVRAYGEMVDLLWRDGNISAALDLEVLWNELGRELSFSLFCAYRTVSADGQGLLKTVCELHSSVVGRAPTEFSRGFPATEAAIASARWYALDVLERWGHRQLCEDAAIVLTELVTNALVHGRSGFTVSLADLGDGVRISVSDASPVLPSVRRRSLTAQSGRGLRLVRAIASAWGVEASATGKAVWADLRR